MFLCLIALGDDAALLSFSLLAGVCRGELLFGFKATDVPLVYCITGGTLLSRDLLNLRDSSMMSFFGAFWGTLLLCGKNLTELTIISDLVLGTQALWHLQ